MKFYRLCVLAVVVAVSCLAVTVRVAAEPLKDIEAVRAEIVKMVPAAADALIEPSPVSGVYRLEVNGTFAYALVDGDFVLLGDLFDTEKQTNLGDQASSERMAARIKDVPTTEMIVFGPENPKRYITVFTDIDCGYCRKLHNEISSLTAAGIQVRYLAFPRAGIGSDSYNKYVSVWCNANRQESLTAAKAGTAVASATCDNPIERNYNLGREVGVRGTPTIIFDDGTVTPGYQPSAQLIERLGLEG